MVCSPGTAFMTEIPRNCGRADGAQRPSDARAAEASAPTAPLRHVLGVSAAIIAIWVIAASRWILTDTVVPWDSKNQFYAFFRFLASALHSGASPFWNPYHYGGHPSVADPQSLVFAPFLLLWSANPIPRWSQRQVAEAGALLASTLLMSGVIFGPLLHSEVRNDPWTFLCTPFLIWAAFRFGPREASAIICLVCAIAVIGTTHGYGPFARPSPNDSLLLLQSFLSIQALTTLVFAAEVSERRRQEEHAKQLAVRDPLTGLANYRLLVERVEEQIKRYGRTTKPFVILLMDLDGLKKINDQYGHLVGSLAICRLAEVLHLSCRETDTAARYGGDEFALVLTETSAEAAALVAQRVAQRLSLDAEEPRLTVSIGIAEFPRDGATIEHLLSAADHSLYNDKGRGGTPNPSRKVTNTK